MTLLETSIFTQIGVRDVLSKISDCQQRSWKRSRGSIFAYANTRHREGVSTDSHAYAFAETQRTCLRTNTVKPRRKFADIDVDVAHARRMNGNGVSTMEY